MGLFTKTATPAPVVTANGLADQLSQRMEANAAKLDARKDKALSSFRRTVLDLRHINQALEADIKLANEMIATCTARKDAAEQAIKDNMAVAQGIINIIGEVPDAGCVDENCDGDCDKCFAEDAGEGANT